MNTSTSASFSCTCTWPTVQKCKTKESKSNDKFLLVERKGLYIHSFLYLHNVEILILSVVDLGDEIVSRYFRSVI